MNKLYIILGILLVLLSVGVNAVPNDPYIIIKATSLNTTDFSINGCTATSTGTSGEWYLNCTGTTEVARALMYKTLFYGTDGTNARVTSTYITGLTNLTTTVEKDKGKNGFYSSLILSTRNLASYTGTFTDTSTNNNVSSWSYTSMDDTDGASYARWEIPSGTIKNTQTSTAGSINEIGIDTTADEEDNPNSCQLESNNDKLDMTTFIKTIILSKGNITWIESGTATYNNINFNDDYSIPSLSYNFKINAKNYYNSSTINNFSIEVNGYANYSTTNGIINTNINPDLDTLYNITIWNVTNYLNRTYTNYNTNTTLNASIYPYLTVTAQAYNDNMINNFTVTYDNLDISESGSDTTTTGTITLPIGYGNYTLSMTSNNYEDSIVNISLPNTNGTYKFSNLLIKRSIYITFKDEVTNTIMNTSTIYLDLIGDTLTTVTNTSTTNGTLDFEILAPDIYTLNYYASGYDTRNYYLDIGDDDIFNITLYLLNNTLDEQILFTVVDNNDDPLSEVIIKANALFPSEGIYKTVAMCRTAYDGQCAMLLKENKVHSYTLEYSGLTKSISPFILYELTKTFIFDVTGIFETLEKYKSLSLVPITYNTATNNFRFEYNVLSGASYTFCLNVYNETYPVVNSLLDSSCSTSSSGTILVNVPFIEGNYKATATANIDGNVIVDTFTIGDNIDFTANFGVFGLFLAMLLILVVSLMGTTQSPSTAIIYAVLGMSITFLVGLLSVSWGWVVGIIIIGVVIAYKIGN